MRSGLSPDPDRGAPEHPGPRPVAAADPAPQRRRASVGSVVGLVVLGAVGPVVGRVLSHAHNVRARRFEPNLQRIRAVVNGGTRRIRVCTRCLRSNRVIKAA